MTILYFWIASAIIFLIIEMMTATFYGLSLALSSAIVATYVYFSNDSSITIIQGSIFALLSLTFALLLPKVLRSSLPDTPQGADKYIGEIRSVKKSGDEYKISLDGVEYLIDSEDVLTSWDKVEVISHHGVTMKVKKVNNL